MKLSEVLLLSFAFLNVIFFVKVLQDTVYKKLKELLLSFTLFKIKFIGIRIFVGMLVMLLLVYIFAIPLYFFKRWVQKRDREQQLRIILQKRKEYEEKQKEIQEKNKENAYRDAKRAEWLQRNQVTLYYNTMNGITVVLIPEEYRKVEKYALFDERWLGENIFLPAYSCFIFVTQQGYDKIAKICQQYNYQKSITGWVSEFRDLASKKCHVVRDERIFVPFVNEKFIPFLTQIKNFNGPTTLYDIEYKLFDMQAPKDLHRIK